MYRRLVLLIVGFHSSTCAALAESPPTKQEPPEIHLHLAGRQNLGEAKGFGIAVEVSNPGAQTLRYQGYRPDSFDPPIKKGAMRPIYKVELKQAGKWQQHPIGCCGTGLADLELAPKTSATFGVWVPAGSWEAVRIGLPWHPFGAKEDSPWTIAWSSELTCQEIQKGLPPVSVVPHIAHDPQRPTTFYTLKHADGYQVVSLLRGLFIVVNHQEPYATFEFEEAQPVNSLIVVASAEHQAEVARVLALVDRPDNAHSKVVEGKVPASSVVAYPIRSTDGDAAARVLRSLYLVVNHQVAYARFGYDARTRSLIAIASPELQKQIANVVELLDVPLADKDRAIKSDGQQSIHVYAVRHANGEQLVAKLRSEFVVVNHEKADARFAFDDRTGRLIVIAAEKLQVKIGAAIAALDGK